MREKYLKSLYSLFERDLVTCLLVLGVLSALAANSYEVLALFKGSLDSASQSKALTPIAIKSLKDICIFFIFLFGIFARLKEWPSIKLPIYFWICLFFFAISLVQTILCEKILSGIVAIRWFLPFLLFPIFFGTIHFHRQILLQKTLLFVFLCAFFLQIGQLFWADHYFGSNTVGLALRSPGIYLIPSSMASFTLMTMYYTYFYQNLGWLRNFLLYFLCPLSVILTGSGSGVLAVLIFFCFLFMRILRLDLKLFALLGCIISPILLYFLPFLTGRENIYTSLNERISILSNNFQTENILLSLDSAKGTNTANLVNNMLDSSNKLNAFIADSTLISLISGIGLIGTISFFVLYFGYVKPYRLKWLLFLASTTPFVFSTIAFEVFPFGVLVILNLAQLITENYQNPTHCTI